MQLFDINKIKDSVSKSADEIRKTISDAAEKLPEPAKNIINSEAVKDMAEKGQNMMDALKAKGDELAAVRNADRKERADEAKIAKYKFKSSGVTEIDPYAAILPGMKISVDRVVFFCCNNHFVIEKDLNIFVLS